MGWALPTPQTFKLYQARAPQLYPPHPGEAQDKAWGSGPPTGPCSRGCSGSSLWYPLQVKEVWLGTDLWLRRSKNSPAALEICDTASLNQAFLSSNNSLLHLRGWILPFTQAPLLPLPVNLQVPATGGPWSFQAQLLKTHAPLNEQPQARPVKRSPANRLAAQTARQ